MNPRQRLDTLFNQLVNLFDEVERSNMELLGRVNKLRDLVNEKNKEIARLTKEISNLEASVAGAKQKVIDEGGEAYLAGLPHSQCPYKKGTEEYLFWDYGYERQRHVTLGFQE